MRTLMTAQMDTEATNQAIKDGSIAKTMQSALEQLHAEAAYFTTHEGQRTAYIIFDLHDTNQMPEVTEPFFMGMKAKIDMAPVMNADDLQEGLARLPRM